MVFSKVTDIFIGKVLRLPVHILVVNFILESYF
jgi:hypothetical protein